MQFLLNAGMNYVLTDIFSKDRQRAIGRRKDNPNLWAVGNVQSEYNASKIDTTPVPKRKRTNNIQL